MPACSLFYICPDGVAGWQIAMKNCGGLEKQGDSVICTKKGTITQDLLSRQSAGAWHAFDLLLTDASSLIQMWTGRPSWVLTSTIYPASVGHGQYRP